MSDPADTIQVLDHGFVALTAVMGDDRTPAQVARTSFNKADQERPEADDLKLLRYLIRERHTTPLEFCQLRYYLKLPMFVAQQVLRHRTASVNQVSYRYVTPVNPEFYVPEPGRMNTRPASVKQGSGTEQVADVEITHGIMDCAYTDATLHYQQLLDCGLAPEIARAVLPAGVYTEMYWQVDLHNFLHFAGLRTAPDAQWETRQYAHAMVELARGRFPETIKIWEELNGTR